MRILITDDHTLFREATVLILEQLGPDVSILEAGDAKSALRLIEHCGPFDLALLDMHLPDIGGVDAISRCLSLSPQTPIMAISGDEDLRLIDAAISAGAAGFMPKSANSREFLAALRRVLAGEIYLPIRFLDLHPPAQFGGSERVGDWLDGTGLNGHDRGQGNTPPPTSDATSPAASEATTDADPPNAAPQSAPPVTRRQRQVLRLMGEGASNKGIASALQISEGTVKQHVSKLLDKFGVRNRTEAVAAATRRGLLGKMT